MPVIDYLSTLSEISIGLIGFAGVVAALGKSKLAVPMRSFRVTLLLLYGCTCLLATLLPTLLIISSLANETMWRLSAAVFCACHSLVFVWSARHVRHLNKEGQLPRWLSFSIGTVVAAIIVLLLNIAIFLPQISGFLYAVSASGTVLLAVYHFVMLVSSIDFKEGAT